MQNSIRYFSLILLMTAVYACKQEYDPILLSPNINETSYSIRINDSTQVLDTLVFKNFDLDNDGTDDIVFSMEERNSDDLQMTEIKFSSLNGTLLMGNDEVYNYCTDSIYFIHYQIYIYRIYNCDINYSSADTIFTSKITGLDADPETVNQSAFSDSGLIYYRKLYTPTITPNGISEDIVKGQEPNYFILIKKGADYYLLKIRWDRPFFIVEEKRKLSF